MSAHCVISIVLAILSSVSTAQWCNWIHSAEPVSAVTHSIQLCFVRILIANSSCISVRIR